MQFSARHSQSILQYKITKKIILPLKVPHPGAWREPFVFFDEYHERIIRISSSVECLAYLKTDWHLHGSPEFYYAALKAAVAAVDGVGEDEDARDKLLSAVVDADMQIIRG